MFCGGSVMLLILRHLESKKNIEHCFSSDADEEDLTDCGSIKGKEVAEYIDTFVSKHGYSVGTIYCANSKRARNTAKIIADKLNVDVCALDEFRSNNSGALRGKSETEAKKVNPLFMKQLKLFRAGIFSSYDFVKVHDREDKHEFEKRIGNAMQRIKASDDHDIQIIVMHHSSLTAAVISYARKFYNYPKDFYGCVACELGNIYLISDQEIILCNEPASKLEDVILSET